jgi:hypothetical protein
MFRKALSALSRIVIFVRLKPQRKSAVSNLLVELTTEMGQVRASKRLGNHRQFTLRDPTVERTIGELDAMYSAADLPAANLKRRSGPTGDMPIISPPPA